MLLGVLLIAGCTPVERVYTPQSHTTVYRYTSHACSAPGKEVKADSAELRQMTKSRNDWKSYAEKLEKLMPKDAERAPHP